MKKEHNKGYHTDAEIIAMQKAARNLGKIKQAEFKQTPFTKWKEFNIGNN